MAISENQLSQRLSDFGARLKQLRLRQNLSQKALADRVGVSLKTVANAEDKGRISLETLLRILDGLGQLGRIEDWIEADDPSPIELLERKGRRRERARARQASSDTDWEW